MDRNILQSANETVKAAYFDHTPPGEFTIPKSLDRFITNCIQRVANLIWRERQITQFATITAAVEILKRKRLEIDGWDGDWQLLFDEAVQAVEDMKKL